MTKSTSSTGLDGAAGQAGNQDLFGRQSARIDRSSERMRRSVLVAAFAYPAAIAVYLNLLAADGDSVPMDFVAFWAAAKLALHGHATEAFDWHVLITEQMLPSTSEQYFGWYYPAHFHLLIAPLGLLPFSAALAVFNTCALGAYLVALRPWRAGPPGASGAYNLAIASPGLCSAFLTGNTTVLWVSVLLLALHALASDRPILAGLFIALLTIKPQLGILIPFALLAAGRWRTILFAIAWTVVICAIATAVFGTEHWVVFFQTMWVLAKALEVYLGLTETVATWYSFVQQVGGGHQLAIVVQLFWSVVGLVIVVAVWRRRNGDINLQFAVLLLGTLVATPRAYQYELLISTVAAMFLARAGAARSTTGRAWLGLLWFLPLPGRLALGIDPAIYAPPIVSASLLACAWLALPRRPAWPQPASPTG